MSSNRARLRTPKQQHMRTTFKRTGRRQRRDFSLSASSRPLTSFRFVDLLRCGCLVMLVAISASAKIRVRERANDELAKKTRDAFADFSKGDANVYETMLSNTLALKTATLAQLYELNRQNRRDTVNIIPVLTWRDLLEKEVPRTQKEFLDAYNASRLILDPLFQNLPDIKAALADAQKQLASAKNKKDDKEAELNIAQPDLDKLKTSLGKLKDAAVASNKPRNKMTDLTEFSNLKAGWKDILAVNEWLEAAHRARNAP